MTELLYLADSYLTRFSATVVDHLTDRDRYGVILDRTAFYPTSGGQLHDNGTINGISVCSLDIVEDNIIHWFDSPIESNQVEGVVDWERRFDHMQQHTGQHILSAAFEGISNAATVGFHMSDKYCTIDLDIDRVDSDLLQRIEELVNEVVTGNKPVTTTTVSRDESEGHALRKPPPDHLFLRLVEVEGFDICACGGTHVNRTGEIGLIKITSTENRPGNKVRIEFLCGSRAMKDFSFKHRLITDLGVALTTSIDDVPKSVEKLRGQVKQLRKQNQHQLQQLAELEASHMISSALDTEKGRVVSAVLPDELAEYAGTVSNSIIERGEMIVLLGINAAKPRLMFARSDEVDLGVSDLLSQVLSKYDGWSGGGRPHLAQGGGPEGQNDILQSILSDALEEIRRLI